MTAELDRLHKTITEGWYQGHLLGKALGVGYDVGIPPGAISDVNAAIVHERGLRERLRGRDRLVAILRPVKPKRKAKKRNG